MLGGLVGGLLEDVRDRFLRFFRGFDVGLILGLAAGAIELGDIGVGLLRDQQLICGAAAHGNDLLAGLARDDGRPVLKFFIRLFARELAHFFGAGLDNLEAINLRLRFSRWRLFDHRQRHFGFLGIAVFSQRDLVF